MLDSDVKLGKNVQIFDASLVNIFGCEIGDGTFVGPFVEITRDVSIGKNCKIESHAFICSNVTIEDDVFVGHSVVFTNDLYPTIGRQVSPLKTVVGSGSSLGSNATILPGVTIGKYAVIGSGAVVTKNVPALSIVAGNPAKVLKQFKNIQELKAYITGRQVTAGA